MQLPRRSWRGWHPPWLAGGAQCGAGSDGQRLCEATSARQQVTPTAQPCLGLQVPARFSWLGSPQSSGSLERSTHVALTGGGRLLSSQGWTGVFQALLFRVQHSVRPSPGFTCTSLLPISSSTVKLGRRRVEGEGVVVAPWKGFSALSRNSEL